MPRTFYIEGIQPLSAYWQMVTDPSRVLPNRKLSKTGVILRSYLLVLIQHHFLYLSSILLKVVIVSSNRQWNVYYQVFFSGTDKTCAKCGKHFKHRNHMLRHFRICGEFPKECCPFCAYRSHRKANVNLHVFRMHPNYAPWRQSM